MDEQDFRILRRTVTLSYDEKPDPAIKQGVFRTEKVILDAPMHIGYRLGGKSPTFVAATMSGWSCPGW